MYQLTRDQLDAAAEYIGLAADQVIRTDYSGRAMYGATCPALIADTHAEVCAFIAALAGGSADIEEVIGLARSTRTDSMGLGIVAYWPDLELTDG